MPPRNWRPYAGCPVINGIFGINFGATVNFSLDFLYGAGYNVAGYGNNRVYLTDINAFNYMWPDATMYFGTNGLQYSELLYSTGYYDMSRYNIIYNDLVRTYGAPITSAALPTGGYTTTWFGYNNSYITLTFAPNTAMGGGLRYYTTLVFGN